MRLFALTAAVLLAFLTPGCNFLGGDCISTEDARTAYDAAEAFLEDLGAAPFTVRLEGTVEGDVGTFVIAADPAGRGLRISSPDSEWIVKGKFASDGDFYFRDYDQREPFSAMLDDLFADDTGVEFVDDLRFADFEVDCVEVGGRDAVEFRYEQDDRQTVLVVEKVAPYRPLSGREVDPALQDNFRISFSYEVPDIEPDSSLPRLAVAVDPVVISDFLDSEGGRTVRFAWGPASEWAPLGEIDLQIVGNEEFDYGFVYGLYDIQVGVWEIDEGYYEFLDRDGNGLVSEGDILEVGLFYGFGFDLWDDWAGEVTPDTFFY